MYVRRTAAVRPLSVVGRAVVDDTAHMERNAGPTAFVTGAAGLIGTELVKVLVARGFQVFGLVRSRDAARHLRHAGAIAITGDLLVPGQWQDEAAADWVFHIPPCALAAPRFRRRAGRLARTRVMMDAHLLDAVAAGPTRRIVYVTDTRCCGPTGARPVTEDELSELAGSKCCVGPALDRVAGYVIAGLPIVTALPGYVYGNVPWFRERIVDPVMAGRRVWQLGRGSPWVSPIHVHDCARALAYLAERGGVGSRYFLANDEPIQMYEFARVFARIANRPLRVWRVPAVAAALLAGRLVDYPRGDVAISNIRLRGTGFRFRYPTLDEGLEQVLGALDE
jgi:nucleoside-diphosphate-sugar epimerase